MINKARLKKTINSIANKLGMEIITIGEKTAKNHRIIETLQEACDLYREQIFIDLPKLDNKQLELIAQRCGTSIGEALYILNAIKLTEDISGDICEFGVAQGATSVQIAYMIRNSEKKLYLVDSFEGLSKPHKKDILIDDVFELGSMDAYEGSMAIPAAIPFAKLKSINFPSDRSHMIKQMITGKLENLHEFPAKVSFAYLDMDLYEPTKIALDWFHTVSDPGAMVIVDDYGYLSSGVETAVKEFRVGKDYEIQIPVEAAGHFCILKKL